MKDLEALEFGTSGNSKIRNINSWDNDEAVVKSLTSNQIRGMQAIEIFNSLLKTGDVYYRWYPMEYRPEMFCNRTLPVPQKISSIEKARVHNFTQYLKDSRPGEAKKFQSIISNVTGEVVEEGDYLASIESYLKYFDFDPDIEHYLSEVIEYTINGNDYGETMRAQKLMLLYKQIYHKFGIPTTLEVYGTDKTRRVAGTSAKRRGHKKISFNSDNTVNNFYMKLMAVANYGVRVERDIESSHQNTIIFVNQIKKIIETYDELPTGILNDKLDYLLNNPDFALDQRVDMVHDITLELIKQYTKKTFKYREIADDEFDMLFDALVRNSFKDVELSTKLMDFCDELLISSTIRIIKARIYAKVINS